jgi:Xaa-Pro aminopeptidase
MAQIDRKLLGQHNTGYEHGVDFDRLRRERLGKLQKSMAARDIGAMLLTNPVSIRYATGVSVMPLWTAVNYARYVLIPVEGMPVIFEYPEAMFRASQFWDKVHPTYYWQARFVEQSGEERSNEWAAQLVDYLTQWGVKDSKIAIDTLDYHGFSALNRANLTLTDADDPLEAARVIKTQDEIELLRLSAAVCDAALFDLEQAIRPGITENELLAIFWHRMLAMGGEWCTTRLLASGHKTNPWFNEAGSKIVRPGDLVGIDTDMIGPEGYLCDTSRTFLCGEKPTREQKEAYQFAADFVRTVTEMCTVGTTYDYIINNSPKVPEKYWEQRYSVILHGCGTDDEPPFVPFPGADPRTVPQGAFEENMVVSVEFYAGAVGGQDGVKLEDQIWITKDGPKLMSLYPYEEKLLN